MSTQTASHWQSDVQRSRIMLLNNLLLVAMVSGLLLLVVYPVVLTTQGKSVQQITGIMIPFVIGWLLVLVAWALRRLPHSVRASVLLLLVWILGVIVFYRGGLPGGGRTWILLLPILGLILMGQTAGIVGGIVSILTYAGFSLAFSQKWIRAPNVAADLTAVEPWLGEGVGFLLVVVVMTGLLWLSNREWVEALVRTSVANEELSVQRRELEMANVQLARQASQLQATAEIARVGSSTLDPAELSREVVNHVQEGFSTLGVYFVGLFLLDATQKNAVLEAATGEAGRLLLEMGYKVEVDEATSIGRGIIHQQACIASNLEEGSVRLDALPMPHTRSEIALPLRSRGRVLGALSVQSTREAAFSDVSVPILQMMADQVAIAIDNARLFTETQAALQEAQATHRRYLVESWREFLAARPVSQVEYVQPGVEIGNGDLLRQTQHAAVAHQRTVAAHSPPAESGEAAATPQAALVVPLKLRGQVIGTLALHETRRQRPWTAEEVALAETVAEQVALTVENLRLMDEAQRRAGRERLTGEVTARMSETLDIETILKTATQEIRRTLGVPEVIIRLAPGRQETGSDRV